MPAHNDYGLFQTVIEALLQGKIICAAQSEQMHDYLQVDGHQEDIDRCLRRIGRGLRQTNDGAGFYAVYLSLDDKSARQHIKQQFSEAVNDLEPLVRWLRLLMNAQKAGTPFGAGDTIRPGDLIKAIEDAPNLANELDRLSKSRMFRNTNTEPRKQLEFVFKRLDENQYLVPSGPGGLMYIATAKWSRLYEVLDYIASSEQITVDEDNPDQADLLSGV